MNFGKVICLLVLSSQRIVSLLMLRPFQISHPSASTETLLDIFSLILITSSSVYVNTISLNNRYIFSLNIYTRHGPSRTTTLVEDGVCKQFLDPSVLVDNIIGLRVGNISLRRLHVVQLFEELDGPGVVGDSHEAHGRLGVVGDVSVLGVGVLPQEFLHPLRVVSTSVQKDDEGGSGNNLGNQVKNQRIWEVR